MKCLQYDFGYHPDGRSGFREFGIDPVDIDGGELVKWEAIHFDAVIHLVKELKP